MHKIARAGTLIHYTSQYSTNVSTSYVIRTVSESNIRVFVKRNNRYVPDATIVRNLYENALRYVYVLYTPLKKKIMLIYA